MNKSIIRYILGWVLVLEGILLLLPLSLIHILVQLFGDQVEAIEFRVGEGSPVTGTPLTGLSLKDHMLITCINRGGRIIIPRGNDMIQPGDSVIVVTTQKGIDGIEDILAG